jgi:hypothetical protein
MRRSHKNPFNLQHARLAWGRLDALEDRTVPAVSATFDATTGLLRITGDDGNDTTCVAAGPGGFVEVTTDGKTLSSDPMAADYLPDLAGATGNTLTAVAVTTVSGWERLVIGDLKLAAGLTVAGADELEVAGRLVADGAVALSANRIVVDPTGAIRSQSGSDGGSLELRAPVVFLGGCLQADGIRGGQIQVSASNLLDFGTISADGTSGGGTVLLTATGRYLETTAALIRATGGAGVGGWISISSGTAGSVLASGRHLATGETGGKIDVLGQSVRLVAADADASGQNGGGSIRVGGDFHGANPAVTNARTTSVSGGTVLRADALAAGAGGTVVVWADEKTEFSGAVSACGVSVGGSVEVSGRGDLSYGGSVDTQADNGPDGRLLMDPMNLIIRGGAQFPQFSIPDPNPDVYRGFGASTTVLPNGNVVVGDPYDSFAAPNAGAVYLFDGRTGALISTLTGDAANDYVYDVRVLPENGNYVVVDDSSSPDNVSNAGSVTWGSNTLGVSGLIGYANSVIGRSPGDLVGATFRSLTNGNYVVGSSFWTSYSGATNAGIAQFCTGSGPTTGLIGNGPSIVGTSTNDHVGQYVTALPNGNYVVTSPNWSNGSVTAAGAVTWGNGVTGTSATVGPTNSLVGTSAFDQVGDLGVTALPVNSNYVVAAPYFDANSSFPDVGAVKICSGVGATTGPQSTIGTISAGNAFIGKFSGDEVGYFVTALPSGNFVVSSPFAATGSFVAGNAGSIPRVGATTWINGVTGLTGSGVVGTGNSIMGSTAYDYVGYVWPTVLANGNYVFGSPYWHNGSSASAGAATWGSGTAPLTGIVSAANSVVGSHTSDDVGDFTDITPLTNGNCVVGSPYWDNGSVVNAGAATWMSGVGPTAITISAFNSLLGSTANDDVGLLRFAISNGNYVVASPEWTNGALANVGAVTWANGNGPTGGAVSAGNSLIGSTANDGVGSGGITVLPVSGDYVVDSPNFSQPGFPQLGAVKVCSGTGVTSGPRSVIGTINAGNAFLGNFAHDQAGSGGVTALPSGNFVVDSPYADTGSFVAGDTGSIPDVGAVTWISGANGLAGSAYLSAANSLMGGTTGDMVGSYGVTVLANGNCVVTSPSWSNGGLTNVGAATWINGTTGITGTINAANSVLGSTSNSGMNRAVDDPVNNTFLVPFAVPGSLVIGIPDPSQLTYPLGASASIAVDPAQLTGVLSAGTNLVLEASNDITVDSPIVVDNPTGNGGNLTLRAGRSIILNASINTDGGNLTLIANDTLADGVVDADRDPGSATITVAPGASINTGSGSVLVQLLAGTGKTYSQFGDVSIGGITTTANLAVGSAAEIQNVGPLVVGGLTTLTAGTNITVDDPANDFGTLSAAGGDVTVTDANSIVLGTVVASGTLHVTAGGPIGQTGGTTAAGAASFAAANGAAIALTSGSNDFQNRLDLATDGSASVADANTLVLGNVTVGGTFAVATNGALTDAGTLSVLGATSLGTGGNPIALNSAGNNFVGLVTVAGTSPVTLVDIDSLALGSATFSSLSATAGGQVSETGPLTVIGATAITGGSVALDTSMNSFGGTVALSVTGNAALKQSGTLKLAASSVGGTLSVSAGSIGQTGPLVVTGSINLTGAIGLTNASNDFGGTVSLSGASANISDANVLTLGTIAVSGPLTAIAGSSLTVLAPLVAQNSISLTAGTDIALVGVTTGAHPITLLTGGNSISLGKTTTVSPGGSLSAANGLTVGNGDTLTGGGSVVVGTGAEGLSVKAGGTIDPTGTLVVNGDLTLAPGSVLAETIDGTAPGQFSVLAVYGAVTLNGSTIVLTVGYTPALNDAATILANDGSDPIVGTFTQGYLVTAGGAKWQVNYAAPDGNDLKVTATEVGLNNSPPTLSDVPVSAIINEQTTLAFTATASDIDIGQTLTFGLVDPPAGATISPSTGAFSWAPTEAQGPDTFVFDVTVTDGTAVTSQQVTVIVNEVNTAPTLANVPGSVTTAPGSPISFTATATDMDIVNGHGNTLTFSLVGAPSGASIDPDTGAFSWTPGDFNLPGNYTFKVRVSDDGTPSMSDSDTITISVRPAAVANGDLLVGGTAGNDAITVNPSKDGSQLIVRINKAVVGMFPSASVTGKIVVHGLSGNDAISISPKVPKTAWLFGDGGNDKLTGGGGSNLLVGGDGNDMLTANAGTNALIGGLGADKLVGGPGDDLLIGGPTVFDADPAGLANLFSEWTSVNSYSQRVTDLTNGVNGTALTAATVQNDFTQDTLAGKKGTDWFIVSAGDRTDAVTGETATTIL